MGTPEINEAEGHESLDAGGTANNPDVSVVLLATKLTPPVPVPGLLHRPGLVEELAAAPGKLCLISAHAGWGKTSLLASWHDAEAEQRPFAFLHLEPSDDDAPVFWTYLIAAIRTVHPEIMAGADAALRTPGMNPMSQVVPALINELSEIDEPMVLVLDDYHLLTQERLHTSVFYLIDHLPPSLRLVIATRSDPPFPLGRLRASGDLTEIRASHLSFSEAETAEFLNLRFGLELDTQTSQLLHQRTEGWPAALHLAGLSLTGESDRRGFVERFTGDDRNIADYLIGEVLGGISAAQREFLLRTSVLDQLTGSLCDAVADVSDSGAMLEELERAGLFVIPLDHHRQWYRYHHLFGEWLRHELRRTDSALIPELHLKASRWHADHGSYEPAISHAVAAEDHDRTADLIDRYLTDWSQVHWSHLWQWLEDLPDDVIEAHSMAAMTFARIHMFLGDVSSSLRWVNAAESGIDALPSELQPIVKTRTAVIRAYGELVAGDLETARILSTEIADRERSARSINYAGAVGLAGIASFWAIGALEAIPLLREGAAARPQASIPDGGCTALLALSYAEIGNWSDAETTAQAAFDLPRPVEWYRYPGLLAAHYAQGKVLVARGERDQGIVQIKQGLELAREWIEPNFIAYGCLAVADALSDYTEKRALVREARQLIETSHDPGRIGDLVAVAERKASIRQPSRRTASTAHVEPLTARELAVLRLFRSELSLREIANELYISHNTVKGYTKAIYRKLGVSSRTAAIETARDLDLY